MQKTMLSIYNSQYLTKGQSASNIHGNLDLIQVNIDIFFLTCSDIMYSSKQFSSSVSSFVKVLTSDIPVGMINQLFNILNFYTH